MLETLQLDWVAAHVGTPLKDIPCNMGDYDVEKLSYGTRQFKNLYNIYESNQHLATIATHPASQILQHDSGILKLSNRVLYTENAYNILSGMCKRLCFQFRGISRMDIACDNTTLANGLKHENLIKGYFNEKYLRMGRTDWDARGRQTHQMIYDYLRFGSNKSNVAVYMYNKTLEMQEVKYKPYITETWIRNRWDTVTPVWRIEFAIKAHRDEYASDNSGVMYDMKNMDIIREDGIETMFYAMMKRHLRIKLAGSAPRIDRMKDVKLVNENIPAIIRIKPNRAKDSTKTDKMLIKKISELQKELRGMDFDLAIHCNEMLNYYIMSRGLERWADGNILGYTDGKHGGNVAVQALFNMAAHELHKEGIRNFKPKNDGIQRKHNTIEEWKQGERDR